MGTEAVSGTTTFLFTDIESSTRLWDEEPERMRNALAGHDKVVREAVESNCGTLVKMTGDGMHAAFDDPLAAVNAAVAIQSAVGDANATGEVILGVRCGLHLGAVERRNNDYFGGPVNRAVRIMSAAYGGQILLSQAVVDSVRARLEPPISLRDLGSVRLKDLSVPEDVYQLVHPKLRQEFPALRSLEASPNNLSQHSTSFIGRAVELTRVKKLLQSTRLLTLLGPGGVGKTRLSMQVAADILDEYVDGVWFVDLAPVTDPTYVPHTVARVFKVREEPGKALLQTLCAHTKSRRMLLVLDNCEHLIDACARLVEGLFQEASYLQILTTTREPLHIAGEQIFSLGVLSLPDANDDLQGVQRSEAVRLFVDRAQAQVPLFAVTGVNARAVAEICTRLDGIPLALELAAACISTLPVEIIAERLSDRFQLLDRGSRLALPRQKTLRAMLDWSYDLLATEEKQLFVRLSVFAGGWTLAAAESVASGADSTAVGVVNLLTNLVEKSLVVVEQGGHRYRMLETIQEYAHERLREEADSAATHLRHCDYFTAMAQTAKPALDNPGSDRSLWLGRLDREQDNFRAALTWSLAEPKANEAALQLCGLLEQFWLRQAQSREGSKWCEAAIAHAGGAGCTPISAKALLAAGTFAYRLGDYGAARTSLERATAVAEAVDDRTLQTEGLIRLGVAASLQGNFAQAEARFQKAIVVCQETGDRRRECSIHIKLANLRINQNDLPAAIEPLSCALSLSRELHAPALEARTLLLMGDEAWYRGDLDAAEQHSQLCLSLVQAMGDRAEEADPLRNLAKTARARGDFKAARELLLDSFAASREHGDPQYLDEIALMAMALSKQEHAARFAGAADALRHAFGLEIWPVDRERFHEYREQCRNFLGKARYDEAYSSARALNPGAVIGMTRAWLENIDVELAPPKPRT